MTIVNLLTDEHFFSLIFLIPGLLYFFLIYSYYRGWKKMTDYGTIGGLPPGRLSSGDSTARLSVIIPFRNEEDSIPGLINDLQKQDVFNELSQEYPEQNIFEFILVDDNSEDKSFKIAAGLVDSYPCFKLIKSCGRGKKEAILCGIEQSRGDLILTSDADCRREAGWLSVLYNYYLENRPAMIIAPVVPKNEPGIFRKFQSLEFLSLIGSTAGAAATGRPVMCNGANLLYEKNVVNMIDDALNTSEISGDDIFLLQNIKNVSGDNISGKAANIKKIHFLKSQKAAVYTSMSISFAEFISQRRRWVSKARSYRDKDIIGIAILVWVLNLSFLLLISLSVISTVYLYYLAAIILLKFVPDFLLLRSVSSYFERSGLMKYFLALSIIYPFYTVGVALLGLFCRNCSWKGRRPDRRQKS